MRKQMLSAVVIAAQLPSLVLAAMITFEGQIEKVVAEKTEIYVIADGKKNELYFTPQTEVVQAGKPAAFAVLRKGMKVKVTADKVGRRLDPRKVEVLE